MSGLGRDAAQVLDKYIYTVVRPEVGYICGQMYFFHFRHPSSSLTLVVRLFKEKFRGDQAGYGTFTACFLLEPQLNAICLL